MRFLLLFLLLFATGMNLFAQKEEQISPKSEAEIHWDEISTKLETAFYAGKYDLAVEHGRSAYAWATSHFDKENIIVGNSLDNLGVVLHHAGKLKEAREKLEAGLAHAKQYLADDSEDRIARSNNLAMLYKDLSLYEKAIPLFSEILVLTAETLGKEHLYYSIFLNNQALIYWEMGQYERAAKNHKEALLITEKTLGKKHRKYAIRLGNLASDYRDLGRYDEALPLFLEALAVEEVTIGKRHPAHAMTLVNTGTLHSLMGQKEKAIAYLQEGIAIAEEKLGTEHYNYLLYLQELANIYMHLGRYNESLSLYEEILEKRQKKLGPTHKTTLATAQNLSILYEKMGNISKSAKSFIRVNAHINQNIQRSYKYFSESEQIADFSDKQAFYETIQSFAVRHSNEYELDNLILNSTLIYKGLSLNNTTKSIRALRENANQNTSKILSEWAASKKIMAEQYSISLSNRSLQFDSLERRANELASKLARLSVDFQDAQQEIRWQDVQNTLETGEVAIEFSHFQYNENNRFTDSTYYVAYLIRKGGEKVKMVYLFEEKDLGNLKNLRNLYAVQAKNGQSNLRKLIFEPLAAELKDIHTIYYAPSGLLHRINFNAIGYQGDEILADHFDLHKLSSTRELVQYSSKLAYTRKNAVLFGGINYEENDVVINEKINASPDFSNSLEDAFRAFRDDDWAYLAWTGKEVLESSQTLQTAGFEVQVEKGGQATEEKFKLLGKNEASPKVIHLATHAYFFPKTAANQNKKNAFKSAKHPMIRSGLILAGANKAWKGNWSGEKEDGILTAYEIAQMDLSNTELVILSACETGLGDIEGSEGVFGLQRAFKMAGVQHIIMTLWSVKDKQSQEFMTQFYSEWLSNKKSIPAAFRQVQIDMKNKYAKPFNPSLWAGFILIE